MKKIIGFTLLLLLIAGFVWGAGNVYKNWGSAAQIEGAGDAYTTLAGSEEEYTSTVDLETLGYEGCLVTVHAYDTGGAATTGTGVSAYFYNENISGVSQSPNMSFELDKDPDGTGVTKTFFVTDTPYFALGLHELTAADDTDVRVYYIPWRYQYSQLFYDVMANFSAFFLNPEAKYMVIG